MLAGNVDASLKSYSWTLPQVQSSSCKVRLTDISDEKHTDTSITAFTISSPFVQITAPNGGERWASGNTHNITWTALGASRVKLEYSPDEGVSWQVIDPGYHVALPLAREPGSHFLNGGAVVRVQA